MDFQESFKFVIVSNVRLRKLENLHSDIAKKSAQNENVLINIPKLCCGIFIFYAFSIQFLFCGLAHNVS